MRLGKASWALVVALLMNVLLAILLSPLGFETRPPTALTLIGYISIGAVAVGVLLSLASIVVIFRGARLASILAIVGSAVLLFPNVTDKVGAFFALPAPPVISALEYVFIAVLVVTLLLARTVYSGSKRTDSSRRDA